MWWSKKKTSKLFREILTLDLASVNHSWFTDVCKLFTPLLSDIRHISKKPFLILLSSLPKMSQLFKSKRILEIPRGKLYTIKSGEICLPIFLVILAHALYRACTTWCWQCFQIWLWHKIAINTSIPNLSVSLVGFQKFFLFWVAGTILEGWTAELETASFIFV